MGDPVRFYTEADADPTALKDATVCVVGYGNLGASIAANLRDAGLSVVVGNVDDEYRHLANDDGFAVSDVATAVSGAALVYVLVPDEVIPDLFAAEIAPALAPGAAVCFASGYSLAFTSLTVPDGVDILLLAPRMVGERVREVARTGRGFVSYVSVERDATGNAESRVLALAAATGSLQRGALRLSAAQEATLDLLVEQTVGPYLGLALQLAFEVGVEAGLPAEAMVLELYQSEEMANTFQAFADDGFYQSVNGHGIVAEYGGFLRTLELDVEAMREQFLRVLDDIRSGGFARRLQDERDAGYPTMATIEGITSGDDPMSQAEARVRQALSSDRGS